MLPKQTESFHIGKWSFNKIKIDDIDLYSEYIAKTKYPANLWTSNFPYLWATSESKARKKLWKIVDDMLVTFTYSRSGILYLTFLPFGEGDAEKVIDTVYQCLNYCYSFNDNDNKASVVQLVNNMQIDFLRESRRFDRYFDIIPLAYLEKHFSIQKLVSLSGKEFETVRRKINKFRKLCPNVIVRKYSPEDYNKVMKLGEEWAKTSGKKYNDIFDGDYFPKIIKNFHELNHLVLVAEADSNIIGMVSGGELPTGQSWWCLSKFVDGFDGLSEFLIVELAKEINKINPGIELMNAAIDFGPGGLRFFKERFRPALDLKRYSIRLK